MSGEQITLREITKDNWREAARSLKLAPGQENFVAPNWYSILEAIFEDAVSRAVYRGEKMVGYTMHGFHPEYNQYWIARLMVDKDHQGQGIGKAVMQQIIAEYAAKADCPALYISFEPENEVARKLYSQLGFEDTGVLEEGELVYCLKFSR